MLGELARRMKLPREVVALGVVSFLCDVSSDRILPGLDLAFIAPSFICLRRRVVPRQGKDVTARKLARFSDNEPRHGEQSRRSAVACRRGAAACLHAAPRDRLEA
jgi:hypothetical protein